MSYKKLISVEFDESNIDQPVRVSMGQSVKSLEDAFGLAGVFDYGFRGRCRGKISADTARKVHIIGLFLAAASFEEKVISAEDVLMFADILNYVKATHLAHERRMAKFDALLDPTSSDKKENIDLEDDKDFDEYIVKCVDKLSEAFDKDIVRLIEECKKDHVSEK